MHPSHCFVTLPYTQIQCILLYCTCVTNKTKTFSTSAFFFFHLLISLLLSSWVKIGNCATSEIQARCYSLKSFLCLLLQSRNIFYYVWSERVRFITNRNLNSWISIGQLLTMHLTVYLGFSFLIQ